MAKAAELNINLIPSPQRKRMPKHVAGGLILLLLLVLSLADFYISRHSNLVSQQAENQSLQAWLEISQSEEKIYEPVEKLDQSVNSKRNEIAAITKNRLSYAEAMSEIDRITPEAITIIGVEIIPQRVILNGYSPSYSEISRMLANIKSSHGWADVALLSSEMSDTADEVKFTLEIEREAQSQ
ncbi:MAG: PilN domain-containing protein [Syntrophomonadaceae bacterium]|nr:PilN domain-containing protein [Syntrophomonadaceae bacterium]